MEESENVTNANKVIKIAFVGPESTGKTTLVKLLAEKYSDAYVLEYAREYLENLGRPYTIKDIEVIAKEQLKNEKSKEENSKRLLFCDTNLLVIKIWALNSFQQELQIVKDNYHPENYDIHFLCDIDVAWEFDELREHPEPEMRKLLFGWYERELINSKANYHIVSGNLELRMKNCTEIINNFLARNTIVLQP